MAGSRALRYLQLGTETTPGTIVAATTIWRGLNDGLLDDRQVQFPDEDTGYFGGVDRSYLPKQGGTITLPATPVTFEQFPYILEAGIRKIGSGAADGSGTDKIYSYGLPSTAAPTLQTYTLEAGDDNQGEVMEYAFVEKFSLSGKAGEAWMMQSDWRGRRVADQAKTASVPLPSIEEALFQKTSLYLDAIGGTIGTTQVTSTLIAAQVDVTTGWVARWTADGNLYFSLPVLGKPSVQLKLTFLWNGSAHTEKANWRAQTPRLLRLSTIGSALGTPGTTYSNRTINQDFAGRWLTFDKLGEDSGNDVVQATFQVRYNATAALNGRWVVVNELTALP